MNNKTLHRDLRELMGFDGFVLSDWGAVFGPPKDYLAAGCDSEQGFSINPVWYNEEEFKKDGVTDQLIFTAAYRIAKSYIKLGLYEKEKPDHFTQNVTSAEHLALARHGIEQSTVLLKNKGNALPILNPGQGGFNILVIGNDSAFPVIIGGGSGAVHTR